MANKLGGGRKSESVKTIEENATRGEKLKREKPLKIKAEFSRVSWFSRGKDQH